MKKSKFLFPMDLQTFAGGEESVALTLLNEIRSVAGDDYASRIPQATRENIAEVGNTILAYQPSTNTFFTDLLNRIARVVVERMDKMEDIYAVFEDAQLPFGDAIQKIFVDIPKAKPFDGTATTAMLNQEKPVIHVEYTKVDRKIFYKQTISVAQIKEAFLTVAKLDEFIRAITESMAVALGYDKYIMLTQTLAEHCKYVVDTKAVAETEVGQTNKYLQALVLDSSIAEYNTSTKKIEWKTTGAKAFLKAVRIMSRGLKFPHPLSYGDINQAGTALEHEGTISVVRTPISKQVLALEVSSMAEIDVDALAVLFHLDKAEVETRLLELQDGALGDHLDGDSEVDYHLAGFICDRESVERGTSFEDTDSFKNPEGQYINMWNHYWGYMAVSKFKDFVPILVPAKAVSESVGE